MSEQTFEKWVAGRLTSEVRHAAEIAWHARDAEITAQAERIRQLESERERVLALVEEWRSLAYNSDPKLDIQHQVGMNHMCYKCADELEAALGGSE